ncbi:Flp pilus assembly protein CpaB [Elioraea thermophila]|uniref:Flp pilus assembly protein CpaB n=1 Tax=Elioraea thermophila TaxID=2185104 RepID=UPI000DF451FB|nr:Flp pilus assembly protein CpaB [Elioraea thermophila]
MLVRVLLIGVLVLASGVLVAIGLQALSPPRPASPPPAPVAAPEPPRPVTARVLVAARPLPPGLLLRNEDLAARDLPLELIPEGAVRDAPEARAELGGALVRRWLDPGEVLTGNDVLRPRDRGFLAAVLQPNRRAITVGVDAVTGAAGLIWPGDRVDLLLTQKLDDSVAQLSRRVVGETVLTDVRVIAVDQHLTQGAMGATPSPDGRIARTVTLEVTPEEAERVAVASQLGRLSLTIRAMADEERANGEARRSVFGGDVSPALAQTDPTDRPVGQRLQIIRGTERQEVIFR